MACVKVSVEFELCEPETNIHLHVNTLCVYLEKMFWDKTYSFIFNLTYSTSSNYQSCMDGYQLWDTRIHNETWGPTMRHGDPQWDMGRHYETRRPTIENSSGKSRRDMKIRTTKQQLHHMSTRKHREFLRTVDGGNTWSYSSIPVFELNNLIMLVYSLMTRSVI